MSFEDLPVCAGCGMRILPSWQTPNWGDKRWYCECEKPRPPTESTPESSSSGSPELPR